MAPLCCEAVCGYGGGIDREELAQGLEKMGFTVGEVRAEHSTAAMGQAAEGLIMIMGASWVHHGCIMGASWVHHGCVS